MAGDNVVLVGFMGAGKSVCGRMLARRLGRCFVETDDMIVSRDGRSIPEINGWYERHYGDHLDHLKVMEGAATSLAGWPQPKAVVTNSPFAIGSRALEVAKLRPYFREVVGCDMVPRSKPAPDGVLLACEKLGVKPARALMVGDSRFDEGAAKAAGVPFVWFKSFTDLKIPGC